jgi:ribosomal protein S6--L-glutamate ligase
MKLCVISSDENWHLNDLRRAAGADVQIDNFRFQYIADDLTSTQHELCQYDCLLTRAMPPGSLQQIIFRMDVLLKLEQQGVRIVNPPRAIEMSVDKYLALTRLDQANVPTPPTSVSQTTGQALEQFERLGGDVVLKPLFGSMGRGLERICSLDDAQKRFAEIEMTGEVIYQQVYVPHGDFDLRLLVIGEQIFAMKRINENHWISNLAQGASGVPHEASVIEKSLAREAATAVATEIAGVDIVIDQQTGQPYVLEVNSAPSWKGISAVLGIDIGRQVLEYLMSSRCRITK